MAEVEELMPPRSRRIVLLRESVWLLLLRRRWVSRALGAWDMVQRWSRAVVEGTFEVCCSFLRILLSLR